MSEQNSTTDSQDQDQEQVSERIKPMAAATASIAQSLAFTAQSEVDALRNQNTVNMVAMGTAYAKWLQNPVMGDSFKAIAEHAALRSEEMLEEYVDIIKNPEKVANIEKVRVSSRILHQSLK